MPVSRNHDFVNGTTIDAEQVDADLNTLYSYVNGEVIKRNGETAFTAIPTLPGTDPTSANQAVRKSYVDNRFNKLLGIDSQWTGLDGSNNPIYTTHAAIDHNSWFIMAAVTLTGDNCRPQDRYRITGQIGAVSSTSGTAFGSAAIFRQLLSAPGQPKTVVDGGLLRWEALPFLGAGLHISAFDAAIPSGTTSVRYTLEMRAQTAVLVNVAKPLYLAVETMGLITP